MALGEGGMFLWKVSLGKFPIRNYPGSFRATLEATLHTLSFD